MADLKFPIELDGEISEALKYNANRPFMAFSTYKQPRTRIYLPIPEGLSFSDSAEYSTIDLGTIGELANIEPESEGFFDTVKNAIGKTTTLKASQIARIAIEGVAGSSELGKAALFSTKQILNPNTNTTFTGVGLRNFSFSFKLIGRNPDDSKMIRDIHETFRIHTYPESDDSENNIILNYPEIWTIKFFDTLGKAKVETFFDNVDSSHAGSFNESEFIPKIYECYLTGMSTNINSSSSIFRNDGAPVEVDFSLNFQETRTLIRQDFTQNRNRRGPLRLLQ